VLMEEDSFHNRDAKSLPTLPQSVYRAKQD
jgi:hypothetical protein